MLETHILSSSTSGVAVTSFSAAAHGASPEMLEAPLGWPLFAWLVPAVSGDFIPAPSALYSLSCQFPRRPVLPRLEGRLELQGLWRGSAGLGCKWGRSRRCRKHRTFSNSDTTKANGYITLTCILCHPGDRLFAVMTECRTAGRIQTIILRDIVLR